MAKAKKWVYFFGGGKAEGNAKMKEYLGGKGANLAEMTNLGIPVPPGFTIATEVCSEYYKKKGKWPKGLAQQIDKNIAKLEKAMKAKLGDHNKPLLVSVRSGAAVSMPGMMDTVLNLGLNDDVINGIEYVKSLGIVDDNRIGIYGQSHGATNALIAAGKYPGIKAVVAEAGFTDMHSLEGNVRWPRNPWLTVFVGYRWIELTEILRFRSLATGDAAQFYSSERISLRSANQLHGVQCGSEFVLWQPCERFAINGFFKLAILKNKATNTIKRTRDIRPENFRIVLFEESAGAHQTSFLGEIGIDARYQWGPHVALFVNYRSMWLTGIALSPSQWDNTGVHTLGSPSYHGGMVGLEFRW